MKKPLSSALASTLPKAMSFVLIFCMLMTCLTAVTFAAIPDGTHWTIVVEGDVKIGEKTKVMVLTETVANGEATVTETSGVTFQSSDPSVAEIIDGCYILGKKPGVAKITANGFNPSWKGQTRTMLAVVGNGAEEGKTKDFDSETVGNYTESASGYQNLPYSYVEYPRYGTSGKSLYLRPLEVSKYADYGFSETGTFYADKNSLLSPVSIEPGKVTEFWFRHGDTVEAIDRYLELYMPDGARIKFVHKAWGSVWSYNHYRDGSGTITYLQPDGWGKGVVEAFSPGYWTQFVIDGSKVDSETGAGIYTVYVNGMAIFTYEAKTKAKSGFIYAWRVMQLSSGAGNDTTSYYFDNMKMYTLPKETVNIVSNTLNVGEGGKVTIGDVTYTGSGNTLSAEEGSALNFSITPDDGMIIKSISYNGQSLATNTTSVTVAADAVLSVVFEKDAGFSTIPDGTYYTIVADGDVKVGESTKVRLLKEIVTGGQGVISEITDGLTFKSSNPAVAEIVNGEIVGKTEGIAMISVYGFNPSWKSQQKTMLVVVSKGAKESKNFDSETTGIYKEDIGGYTNLPYSYLEYPRHGLTGKALSIDPLKVNLAHLYGTKDIYDTSKDDVLSPITIEPGMITEFWLMSGSSANPLYRYLDFCFPDGGKIGLRSYNDTTTYAWKAQKRFGDGTFVHLDAGDGWGTNGFSGMGAGTWAQFVVDGSKVDADSGEGIYTVYHNGRAIFTYEASQKTKSGFISILRSLKPDTEKNSNNFFVDTIKQYELTKPIINTIEAGEGTIVIGKERYTGQKEVEYMEGEKVYFVVQPPAGKMTKKITYNNTVLSDEVDYFIAVKDAKLEVTYGNYTGSETTYYDVALNGTLREGKTTGVTVTKTITPTNIKNNKAAVVTIPEDEYVLVAEATPESDVLQINEDNTITGLKKGMQKVRVHAKNADGSRGEAIANMLVVVVGTLEAGKNYNQIDTKVVTETLKGESAGNTVLADYQYTVKPAHGKDGTSLYYRNVDKPESMTGSMDMVKKADGVTQFVGKKAITEFWIYCDGYTDSMTSLFFVNGPGLRFWLQMSHSGGTYFLNIAPKNGAFAENNTSVSGYNTRVPMKRGWNQVILDGRGDNMIVYCNGLDFSAYIPTDGTSTTINNIYYDRFIYPDNQVNNYMFLDDYKVYSMDDATPVSNTIEAGEGTVTINEKSYTGTQTISEFVEGEDMDLTVTPPQNKLVDSIFYNGQELGDKVDYVTVVKDATLKITYRDDPAMMTPSIVIYDKKPINIEPTKENPYSTHIVYAQMTGWKLVSDYGMKLTSQAGNSVMLPGFLTVQALDNLATNEGKFAVKIFGDGMNGVTCTLAPYLVYNGETSYGESSEEFTGTVSE